MDMTIVTIVTTMVADAMSTGFFMSVDVTAPLEKTGGLPVPDPDASQKRVRSFYGCKFL